MEDVLSEVVSAEDLKNFEQKYHSQLTAGHVDAEIQFQYAWCLVRSKYPADLKKGVILLEELLCSGEAEEKRDYLFYMAVGNAKLKDYPDAMKYVRALLQAEPGNRQAQDLERIIKRKMEKEGLMGMAIAGGAVLAIGSLIGLGVALAKKH